MDETNERLAQLDNNKEGLVKEADIEKTNLMRNIPKDPQTNSKVKALEPAKIKSFGSSKKVISQDEMLINSAHAVINGEMEKQKMEDRLKLKNLKQKEWERELQEELLLRKKQL